MYMRLKIIIAVFTLMAIKVSAFSQNNSLNGTWVLDSVQIIKHSDKSTVDVKQIKGNSFFALYDTIMFKGNEMTIYENGYSARGEITIFGKAISFSFVPATINWEYNIKDGILFLEQRVTIPSIGNLAEGTYIILTQYKKQ